MKVFNEYKATMRAAAVSWGASIAIIGARMAEIIPANVSSISFLTIGVGVAASISISRFRLTDAITQVFRVGLTARAPATDTSREHTSELMHHLSTCTVCRECNTVVRRCSRGQHLVRRAVEEHENT